jgi:hypothetical protein
MAAIDDLAKARLLLLDISYHASLTWGLIPISLPRPDQNLSGMVFPKEPDTLDFTFDAQQLQIPALQSQLLITMKGAEGVDSDHVRWEPSLKTGSTPVSVQGVGMLTIDGVGGAVTCGLMDSGDPLIGPAGPSVPGEFAFYVQLTTSGSDNSLTAHTTYAGGDTQLALSNLAIMGRAGVPVDLAVSIRRSVWSDCFYPWQARVGDIAEFSADVTAIPDGASVGFEWATSDAGAMILGSKTMDHARVQLPNNPQAIVTVTVTVTVTGADGASQVLNAAPFNVFVLDPQLAERMEFFCKIFMETPTATVARFINPMWDPLRDLVTRPADQRTVEEVATFLRRLSSALGELRPASPSRIRG